MAWTPPASTSLSSNDVDTILDGLRDGDHRDEALAFVYSVDDIGMLRVVACALARRNHEPFRLPIWNDPDAYRNYIRTH